MIQDHFNIKSTLKAGNEIFDYWSLWGILMVNISGGGLARFVNAK